MTPPDWLTRHDGNLKLAPDGRTWLVHFDGAPHYKLIAFPAGGQFTCMIAQTENGKRVAKPELSPTADAALAGGLQQLRTYLGW